MHHHTNPSHGRRYVGTDSVYTLTSSYERDEGCPVCSAGVTLRVSPAATLAHVIAAMLADGGLGRHLAAPSVSYGAANLYMRGALEEETRPNLDKASCRRSTRGAGVRCC